MAETRVQARRARRAVDQRVGEARAVGQAGKAAQARLAELTATAERLEAAAGLLTRLGEARQLELQQVVESLVTEGLQAVFSPDLSCRLCPEVRRGQLELDLVVVSRAPDGTELVTPVLDARGGGLAVVVAFLLRVVVLLLTTSHRRLLVLDESFSHVSSEYEPMLMEFVRDLAGRAGVQVLLVTHSEAVAESADTVYRFSNENGETRVRRLR